MGQGGAGPMLAQFSSEGNLTRAVRWSTIYSFARRESLTMAIDAQNTIWVTGYSDGDKACDDSMFSAQFSVTGELLHAECWELMNEYTSTALTISPQGQVSFAGSGFVVQGA